MIDAKWTSLILISLLSISMPLGAATSCSSVRQGVGKFFGGDLDCLLHPGAIQIVEGASCPNLDPYLQVDVEFSCEECESNGPTQTLSARGVGECSLDVPCRPLLEANLFESTWAQITIRNYRSFASLTCKETQPTVATKYCSCPACENTPILISLENGAVLLTSVEDGVDFDLDADGEAERIAWTQSGSDEAFLVLDRNENGLVDDGSELFGDTTPQPVIDPGERNGFEALAVFDDSLSGGNEDGRIDADDAIFSSLQLWVDSNHDGVSNAGELTSLDERGLESIELDYRHSPRRDRYGNEFRYRSRAEIDGRTRIVWDVVFVGL